MVIAGVCAAAIVLTSTSTFAADEPQGDPSAAPSASATTTTTPTTAAEPTVSATSPAVEPGDATGLLTVDGPAPAAVEAPESVPSNDIVVPPAADNAATEGLFGAGEVALPSASSETIVLDTPAGLDAKVHARGKGHGAANGAANPRSLVVGAAAVSASDAARSQYLGLGASADAPGVRKGGGSDHASASAISVEVIPQLDGGSIPAAAFAARLSVEGGGNAQTVDIAFDTSGLANAFGGDYADRLQFVALPACALTTPDVPGCLDGALLETRRDADGIVHVRATASNAIGVDPSLGNSSPGALGHGFSVPVPASRGLRFATTSGGTIIAAVSGADSQSGTFKATDLAPRGTWGVSEPTGSFTYSIPVAVPPVTAGPVPNLALSYSSQSTDGKSFASNAQASIIGEGWTMPVSYIERLYKPCSTDGGAASSSDQCWASPYSGTGAAAAEAAYVLSLNGRTEELVWTSTSGTDATYTAASDPTLKVVRHFGATGRKYNGDNDGEWFEVKTSDGSRYRFGYEPYGTTNPTHSIAYEPVLGNNADEPGYGVGDGFVAKQAYRFMLDLSYDASMNAMTYFYSQAVNNYLGGVAPTTTSRTYVRDTQLQRVEYGQVLTYPAVTGDPATLTPAEAKVEFDLVDRCVERGQFYDPLMASGPACEPISSATASSYPDVPADLICEGTCVPNAAQTSPVYFATVRLNAINTYVADSARSDGWRPVDTNQLISAFPTTNDGSARSLWLDSVYTHAWGIDDSTLPASDRDDEDTYLIKFSGIRLNNRVDWNAAVVAGAGPQRSLDRMRISSVWTEMGGRIDVTYASATPGNLAATGVPANTLCPQDGAAAPDYLTWIAAHPLLTQINTAANTQLCYAVKRGADTEIFHNYVATAVSLVDTVAGTPTQTNTYTYGGTPGYALADSVLYAPGSPGDTATFSSYRGFLTVSSGTADPTAVVPPANLRTGDFNGDGKADLFTSTAAGQWMYSPGGAGAWVNLGSDATIPLSDLRFGDFNGDGKTDVFSRTSAGQWRYASAGTGPWVNLRSDATLPLADLRFGNFDAGPTTDVFSHQAAGRWQYSPSGTGAWVPLTGDDATAFADLRFGDFNADGLTDVFSRTSTGVWRYSPGGIGGYVTIAGDGSVPLSSLVLADINGDHKADVLTSDAAGNWRFSSGGTLSWAALGAVKDASFTESQLADFTGDGKADLLSQEPLGGRKASNALTGTWSWLAAPTTTTTTNQYYRGLALPMTSLYDGAAKTDDVRLQGRLESSKKMEPGTATPAVVSTSATTYTFVDRTIATAPAWKYGTPNVSHTPHFVMASTSRNAQFEAGVKFTETASTTAWDTTGIAGRPPVFLPTSSTTSLVLPADPGGAFTQCVSTAYTQSATPYIVAPTEVASFKGPCVGGTLKSKSETLYDGATDPAPANNVPTLGRVTAERSYATATEYSTSEALYDDRGRIIAAWMPNDVAGRNRSNLSDRTTASIRWDYVTETDGTLKTTITRPLDQVSTTWTEPARGNVVKSKGATANDWTHYQYDALGLLIAGWAPASYGQETPRPSLGTNTPTALFVYNVTASGPTLRTTPVVVTSAQYVKDNGTTYTGHDLTSTVRRSYTFLDGWGRTLETHVPAPDGSGGQTVTATHYNALGQTDWTSAPFYDAATASVLKRDSETAPWKSALVNPAPEGLASYTLTTYDTRGRTISQSLASHGSVVSLGAVPGVPAVPGLAQTTRTQYSGFSTTTIAPDGSSTSTTSDVLGRMKLQTQCPAGSGATCAEADAIITSYAYATLDGAKAGWSRTTVTDAEGHATVFESDLAGQRRSMTDPAAGTSTYAYDLNGQTLSVSSPAGTIAMEYDDLGRMTERTSGLGTTTTGSSSATWDYVTQAKITADPAHYSAADLGLLHSSSSTTVAAGYSLTTTSTTTYDAKHRPVSSTVKLPVSPADTTLMGDLSGLEYVTGVGYDALGQVTSTTMPALGGLPNEKSVVGYRLSGQAQTLKLQSVGANPSTSTTLVESVAFDGTGQLVSREYGNDVTRAVSYNSVTRQISGLSASFESGTPEAPETTFIQADSFTRDGVGRLTQIASAVPNGGTGATATQATGQCFTYDAFNRLKSAWTIAGTGSVGACANSAPTADTDPAWDASDTSYATQWTYSKSGQISTIINGAATPVTANLTYGQTGAPASGITTMTDGSTTNTYAYDGAGRQTTRTIDGVATTMSWDVSSKLVQTSGAGGDLLYAYDASGQRVAKIQVPNEGASVTGAVTGYLGSTELTDADTSFNATDPADLEDAGFVTGTRYYTFGGATVAVRQVTSGEGATIPDPDPAPSSPGPTPSATGPAPSPTGPAPSPTGPAPSPTGPAPSPTGPAPSPTAPVPSPTGPTPPATPATATSTLSLMFGNEQGSAQVMMQVTLDASGAMAPAEVTDPIARNAYTPYGAVRGADNLSISHGWLNKIADSDTGLTYLGARYYDPLTSRFISPDPLVNPMDPKTLDAYMYANNNPITFSDPTGLTPYYQGNTKVADEYYNDGSQYKTLLKMTPSTYVTSTWMKKSAAKAKPKAATGSFDWGTTVAGGINLIWGGAKVYSGVQALVGAAGLAATPGAPASPAVALKGGFDAVTGLLKMGKGVKQVWYGVTHPCAADCGVDGNIRKAAWGTIPGATTVTQGLPALPSWATQGRLEGEVYSAAADWYNGAPRESVVNYLEGPRTPVSLPPYVPNGGQLESLYNAAANTPLIPPASYRDDYTNSGNLGWLDHLGGFL